MQRTWDVTRLLNLTLVLLLATTFLVAVPSCGGDHNGPEPAGGFLGRFRLLNRGKKKIVDIKVEKKIDDGSGTLIWVDVTPHLQDAPWGGVDPKKGHIGHFNPHFDAVHGVRVSWTIEVPGAPPVTLPTLTIDDTVITPVPRGIRYIIVAINEDADDGKGRLMLMLDDVMPVETYEAHHP